MAETPTLERNWPSAKDDRPGFLVRTPYRESFVERLKALPTADRYWDPGSGAWWVADEHLETVEALVCGTFGGCLVTAEEGDVFVSRGGERTAQEGLF